MSWHLKAFLPWNPPKCCLASFCIKLPLCSFDAVLCNFHCNRVSFANHQWAAADRERRRKFFNWTMYSSWPSSSSSWLWIIILAPIISPSWNCSVRVGRAWKDPINIAHGFKSPFPSSSFLLHFEEIFLKKRLLKITSCQKYSAPKQHKILEYMYWNCRKCFCKINEK